MKRLFLFLLILSCIPINYAQQRWKINTDGGITWQVKKETCIMTTSKWQANK